MHRPMLRALKLGAIVAGLMLATPAAPVLAEDGPGPAEDGPGPAATGIAWVKGWEAGRAQAKKDGKLMFVYFGRYSPK